MSMYLSNDDISPTGWEGAEFIDAPFYREHLPDEEEPDHDPACSS